MRIIVWVETGGEFWVVVAHFEQKDHVNYEHDYVHSKEALVFVAHVVFVMSVVGSCHLSCDMNSSILVVSNRVLNLIVTVHHRHKVHFWMKPISFNISDYILRLGAINRQPWPPHSEGKIFLLFTRHFALLLFFNKLLPAPESIHCDCYLDGWGVFEAFGGSVVALVGQRAHEFRLYFRFKCLPLPDRKLGTIEKVIILLVKYFFAFWNFGV